MIDFHKCTPKKRCVVADHGAFSQEVIAGLESSDELIGLATQLGNLADSG
jgi:hypothetical protein